MRAEFIVKLPDIEKGYQDTEYELRVWIGNEIFSQRVSVNESRPSDRPESGLVKRKLMKAILNRIESEIIMNIGSR